MSTASLERLEQLLLAGNIDAQDFVCIARGLRKCPTSEALEEDTMASLGADKPEREDRTLLASVRPVLLNAGVQLGLLLAVPFMASVLFASSSLSVQHFLLSLMYCAMTVLAAQVMAIPVAAVFLLLFRKFALAPRYVYVAASWITLVLLLPSLAASD